MVKGFPIVTMEERMIVKHSFFTPLLVSTLAVICLSGCVPTDDGVTGPQDSGDLAVTATADPSDILTGEAVTFRAVASGGTPPYLFRWDQNDGPVVVDLSGIDVTDDVLTLTDLMDVTFSTMMECGQRPPAAASSGKRDVQVNIRLTAQEKLRLSEAARRLGFKGVSDFVRLAALERTNAA